MYGRTWAMWGARAALVAAALAAAVGPAQAQEWKVRKGGDPAAPARPEGAKGTKGAHHDGARQGDRAQEGLDAWLRILEDDPGGGYALEKVLSLAADGGGMPALVERYRQRAEKDPQDATASLVLGHLQRAMGSIDEAIASYGVAAAADPAGAAAPAALGQLYASRQRWDEALAAYRQAAERTRSRAGVQALLLELARVAYEANRPEEAAAALDQLVAVDPSDLTARMGAARELSLHGLPAQARAAWEAVEGKAGGDWQARVEALSQMAAQEERLGHDDEALALLRRAQAATPKRSGADAEVRDQIVALYRKQGRIRELIDELAPQAGRDAARLAALAPLYEEVGDDGRALETWRKVVKATPRSVEARRQVITLLERLGRADDVIAELRALVKQAPRDPELELELAERLHRAGQKDKAIDLLGKMGRRYGGDPSVHQAIVDHYVRFGADPRIIEDELALLRRLEPAEEAHVLSLGELYWARGDRDRAVATWEKIPTLGKDEAKAWLRLAETFAEHDLVDKADAAFGKALAAAPRSKRVLKRHAQYQEAQARWDAAARTWEKLVALAEGDPDAVRAGRRKIVDLQSRSGLLGARIVAWREAFSRTPPDLDAGGWLAEAQIQQKDWEGAEATIRRILSLRPGDVDAMVALEGVLVRQGDLVGAAAMAEQAAKADEPHRASHLARAAEYALQRGEDGDAVSSARRLVELRPADAGAHARLGDAYRQAGDLTEAMRSYEKAVELSGKDHRVAFRLARLYRDAGRIDDEVRVLRRVVGDGDDPAAVLKAGQRLIQVAARAGALQELEGLILPHALGQDQNYVYRRLLVDLYHRTTRELSYRLHTNPDDREAREQLRGLADRGLKPLLDALAEDDVGIRTKAVEVLRDTRSPAAVLPLVRLLDGKDPELRFQAAVALAFGGGEGAVPALERLAADPETRLRDVAVWALGGVRAAASLAPLRTLVTQSDSARTRALGCMALGVRGRRDGVPTLVEALGDGQATVREAAAWGLGLVADPGGVDALIARLGGDVAPVRRAAAWALGRTGDGRAARPLLRHLWVGERADEDLVSWALWRVADSERATQVSAASIREGYLELSRFKEAQLTLNQSIQRFMTEVLPLDLPNSQQVVEALAPSIADESAAILAADDVTARVSLLGRLDGTVGDDRLALGQLLGHGHGDAAAAAQGRLRAALAPIVPRLTELSDAPSTEERVAALHLLGKVGRGRPLPDAATRAMTAGIRSDLEVVAEAALRAAAMAGDARLAPAVLAAASRDGAPWSYRLAFAHAAAAVGDARFVEPLRPLLGDPSGLVRAAALAALGRLAPSEAGPLLRAALGDSDPHVVRSAIDALVARRDTAAMDDLARVRREGPVDVRASAAAAMAALGGPAPD